ncbi:hypothetical protein D3C71_1990480 [compost metagenome]
MLRGQRYVLNAIGHQVEPEELHRQQRHWQPERDRQHEQRDLRSARGYQHEDHLADVRVGYPALADATNN